MYKIWEIAKFSGKLNTKHNLIQKMVLKTIRVCVSENK